MYGKVEENTFPKMGAVSVSDCFGFAIEPSRTYGRVREPPLRRLAPIRERRRRHGGKQAPARQTGNALPYTAPGAKQNANSA